LNGLSADDNDMIGAVLKDGEKALWVSRIDSSARSDGPEWRMRIVAGLFGVSGALGLPVMLFQGRVRWDSSSLLSDDLTNPLIFAVALLFSGFTTLFAIAPNVLRRLRSSRIVYVITNERAVILLDGKIVNSFDFAHCPEPILRGPNLHFLTLKNWMGVETYFGFDYPENPNEGFLIASNAWAKLRGLS
jgi:hypothetical protein